MSGPTAQTGEHHAKLGAARDLNDDAWSSSSCVLAVRAGACDLVVQSIENGAGAFRSEVLVSTKSHAEVDSRAHFVASYCMQRIGTCHFGVSVSLPAAASY